MGNLAYEYEDERPYEVYDGEVVMMAGASVPHFVVVENIIDLFKAYLRGKKCRVFGENVCVYFKKDADEFLPDVKVVCDPDKITDDGIFGAPDLVAEVLSKSTEKRDRTAKKDVYERYGVKEYWLVSLEKKSIEQYVLEDGKYTLREIYYKYRDWEIEDIERRGNEIVTEFKTTIFDDLTISIDDVFNGIEYKY